ncbi:MAG: transglutaminase-like domain-containing protein [Candidatus Micrarchaeota archaeon]|nr:transglutaminase-like domain-containing protein [Candidatus Micrarchaeota archaeon]
MTYSRSALKIEVIAIFLMLFVSVLDARPTKALLNVTIHWDIISNGVLENATLDVTIPTDTQNQKIISSYFSDPYSIVADAESKIRFEFGGIRSKRITANFVVETDYINRNKNAETGRYDENNLKETKYVIINDEIKNLSRLFVSAEPYNLYEIQNWIYKNIKYNSSYSDVTITDITASTMPSDWVLQKRTGVCDEFSNLFAAIARDRGYPTRLIIGYVYVDGKWIPHAWTESYVKGYGWIEIDPTHNQFMNLNALRVRMGYSNDISHLHDSISATSKDASKINLDEKVEIQIINYTEEKPIDIDIVYSPQPQLDQNQPVIIKLKNRVEAPIFLSAMFIPPVSVECSNCIRQIMVEPKKIHQIEINLKLPPLNPNIKYIFPSTLITDYEVMESSFERIYIEQSLAEKYTDIQSLPNEFQIFIGLFVVAAVALIAIAILLGL